MDKVGEEEGGERRKRRWINEGKERGTRTDLLITLEAKLKL